MQRPTTHFFFFLAVAAGGLWRGPVAAARPAEIREAVGAVPPAVRPLLRVPRREENDLGLSPADEDPDRVLADIVRAEALVAAARWREASRAFQRLLDRHGDVVVPIGDDRYAPAWRYCTLRLSALPPAARAAYRAAAGTAALRALKEARAERSAPAFLEVARRYGATKAGADALDALASLELERGRPASAARLCLRRLELDPDGTAPDPRVLAKLAVALARSGGGERLRALADAIARSAPGARISSGGREGRLADFVRRAAAGAPLRRATPKRAVRPGRLLWRVPLDLSSRASSRFMRGEPAAGAPAFALPAPVVRGGRIFVQRPGNLVAIDALGGRVPWQERWTPARRIRFLQPAAGIRRRPLPRAPGVLAPTVSGDVVIRTFSVETIKNLRTRLPVGRLDAHSVQTGAFRWSVSLDENAGWPGDGRPLRAVAPPTLVGETLCIPARNPLDDNDAFLLGCDAADGRPLWRTHVASTSGAVPRMALNTIADDSPALAYRGLAYYCSNLGTVAAVDPVDGTLLWVRPYEREPLRTCTLRAAGRAGVTVTAPPNPLYAADGTLFVLPSDSAWVYALDAATGAVRWRRPRSEGPIDALYLLGVQGGRLYLSGSGVVCLDVKTGRTIWRSKRFDALPVGRGVLARSAVLCPVQGGIAVVETGSGRLERPVRWKQPGRRTGAANLALLDHRLVVVREDSVLAFASEDFEQVVRDRIRREPEEPRHHLDAAMFYSAARRWWEARGSFRRALLLLRARGETTDAVKRLLADACRGEARRLVRTKAWAEAVVRLGEALELEPSGSPRAVSTALEKARAMAGAGDPTGALAVLHEVLEKWGDVWVVLGGSPGTPARVRTRARFVAGRMIAEVLARHGERAYRAYEERARAVRRDAARVCRLYPNSRAAAAVRLKRAREWLAGRRPGAAAGELLALSRLRPGSHTEELSRLRRAVAAASALPPAPVPKPLPKLLEPVWKRPVVGRVASLESAAAPGADFAGGGEGWGVLLVAEGKTLRAYHPVTGRRVWEHPAGWLGVSLAPVSAGVAGMPRAGAKVVEVLPGQPAEAAGVQAGDLLVSFDGRPVRAVCDLIQLCATTPPGRRVELVVLRAPSRRAGRRRWRLRKLPVTIGRRPRQVPALRPAKNRAPAPVPTRWLRTDPAHFIRVVGRDGRAIVAEVDLVLLWIDGTDGRLLRRAVIDAWRPSAATTGSWLRRRVEAVRGPRPVMSDGMVVAANGRAGVTCFDARGERRWSADLDPGGGGPETAPLRVLKMLAWRGRVAVLAGRFEGRVPMFEPRVFVFDLFSGREVLHAAPKAQATLDTGHLVAAGDRLFVSAADRLFAYDVRRGKVTWSIGANDLGGGYVSGLVHRPGRLVVEIGRIRLAGLDPVTGRVAWKHDAPGTIRRMVVAGDSVFLACENAGWYWVVRRRIADGSRIWKTPVRAGVELPGRNPVPFAALHGNRLILVQHPARRRVTSPPSFAAIRISDGKLLRFVGLGDADRYNKVFGGTLRGGVIGLITRSGLLGISAGESP